MKATEATLHKTTKNANTFLLFLLFGVSIVYIFWILYSIPLIFYIPKYKEITQTSWFALLIIYLTIGLILAAQRSAIHSLGIGLFIFTTTLCCLSTNFVLHLPTILGSAVIDDQTYYLTGELESFDILAYHRLYKCANSHIQCETTPFWEGGGASFRPLHLMVDTVHNKNEINVTYAGYDGITRLTYTYGTPNRYYDSPVQLGNYFYYLAHYRNPEAGSSTYLIYQCNLDNTDCFRLPFEYLEIDVRDSAGFDTIEIEADEPTNEIKVIFKKDFDSSKMTFAEEILIFTYGDSIRCYVEDCKILEETK